MFKNFFKSKKEETPDTLDFEKANPYNKYGRHRITELLSELLPYCGHDDCGEYFPIYLGQITLRVKNIIYKNFEYKLYFKSVLLFIGKHNDKDEYFGEWYHDGLWQDDITQLIKDYLQKKENEKDTERIQVEKILSQYK